MSFKEKSPLVVALYLPQYYETEYNNKWWEKGYTEWVACKRAKPLYPGHNQPRVPLNNNYYDLSVKENIRWQMNLAKEYGSMDLQFISTILAEASCWMSRWR